MPDSFQEALEAVLGSIPPDRYATCGAVARALGDVRAARSVATWIADHPGTAGADRLVRADGRAVLASRKADALVKPSRIAEILPAVDFLGRLRAEQERLASQVQESGELDANATVGGADVAYEGDRAYAAAVTCDARTLEPLEIVTRTAHVDFPYIPTYLAFRELPAVEAAVRGLHDLPDVLLIDGHGRLHPASFGFACYAGVKLGLATIGVAKHPLVGKPRPDPHGTGTVPIELGGTVRGFAWVPPRGTRPLYISVGHRVSLSSALRTVQRVTPGRIPEPLRIADRLSKERKQGQKGAKGS